MANKKRSFEPKPLQEVLQQITAQRNLAKGLNEVKVKQAWEMTVGNNVAQYTDAVQLRGKTLYVKLTSPFTRRTKLWKRKIPKHLNDALGFEGIQKIILR